MKLLKYFDRQLNNVTMYRLLVYGLGVILAAGIGLSLSKVMSLSASGIALNIIVLCVVCFIANRAFAILWNATSNNESWLITALILACILQPSTTFHHLALVAFGGLLAMASKYLMVLHHKHLFNPAAFGAIVLGLSSLLPAIWWVGSPAMLILTTIFGILVLRKIRRFQLFFSFVLAALVVALIVGMRNHQNPHMIFSTAFRSSPLVFLGTVMLTEPETTPPLLWQQRIYGVIVGALFTSQLRFHSISATPELALIIGNIYAYVVSPKYKLHLRLKSKQQLAPHIYDFSFEGDYVLDFKPGQYMEWTLGDVQLDRRGNRRTFSLASAPGERELHIAIKTAQSGSNYKNALVALEPGDSIIAGQLAGDFLLPKDTSTKLVFVAGGIGITPFVSMAKDMIAKKQQRDIVLFYIVADADEYCYQEVWKQAQSYGLRVVPVLSGDASHDSTWPGLHGRLTDEVLKHELSDYLDRRYYLSGPNALVENYSRLLYSLHIKRTAVVTDHFSGY